MHGVGSQWVKMAFFVFGHPPFIPVLSQIEPDPEFPTVTFPNPEENGVIFFYLF
jgi:phosphomannomutase